MTASSRWVEKMADSARGAENEHSTRKCEREPSLPSLLPIFFAWRQSNASLLWSFRVQATEQEERTQPDAMVETRVEVLERAVTALESQVRGTIGCPTERGRFSVK